jgi:ATP-dependent DNA helicase RecG
MDLVFLLTLPESKTLEFKRDVSSLGPILKTIVAFANTAGGTLVIGKASDGKVVGVEKVFAAEESLASAIADSIFPRIMPEIEMITVDKKDLLVVRVSYWRGPFYIKKEGMPNGVYIRLGSTSRPAGPEILTELQRSVSVPAFDYQPIHELSKSALDLDFVKECFQGVGKEINEENLRSLGIVTKVAGRAVPTVGGLVLFGKKDERMQFMPDAEVRCARFLGTSKASILDHMDIEGTVIHAIEEVPKFIARNTRVTAEFGSMQRRDIPEYPKEAVREALINAFAHADYSVKGSHIQVAIFNDRLEIQNPGMLPFGFTLEDLKSGVSRIRNRVIAQTFHALKFMEKWGSGYKRIMDACRAGGYPEPKWEEIGMNLRVTFYPHSQSILPGEFIAEDRAREALSEREMAILAIFKKPRRLPFREIFKRLSFRISERTLRYDLAQLKAKGAIISQGKGRSQVWVVV